MEELKNSNSLIEEMISTISSVNPISYSGKITKIKGNVVEVVGLSDFAHLGSRVNLINKDAKKIPAEVIGFNENVALVFPIAELENIGVNAQVQLTNNSHVIFPDQSWLGRVIDANCLPIDQKDLPFLNGNTSYYIKNKPPMPSKRRIVGSPIDLGVKALNCFTTLCDGQRIGIFSGSGVGKSILISMISKYSTSDVKIIGLVGERGREVQEFVTEYLGDEGLKNTIVVVATGDESPIIRKQAAYVTLTLAEYFRDQGKQVLCVIDSITRFAMAQREIGLAANEPITTKAYTPSVFSELPKLLERAGPGHDHMGNITGIFTVLVDGDDHNEPISDAARGILDGHIILDRGIAERGRYPAVNILKSVSRMIPKCHTSEQTAIVKKAIYYESIYDDMKDMIRLGAYKSGSNPDVDTAIIFHQQLENFLSQTPSEKVDYNRSFQNLANIYNTP